MALPLLDRMLLRETLPPLGVGLLAVLQLLVLGQLLQLNEVIFGSAVGLAELGLITLALLPHFLVLALPLAYVLGVQLGLGRLATDREILALGAAGRSPLALYRVPAALALVLGGAAALLARQAEPWGLRALNRVLDEVIQRNLEAGLVPGVFNNGLPRFLVYVEERSDAVPAGEVQGGDGAQRGPGLPAFRHLLIEDRTAEGAPPLLALAEEGRIVDAGGGTLALELRRGELFRPEEDGELHARFREGRIGVDVAGSIARRNRFATSEGALPGEELEKAAARQKAQGRPDLAGRARLERARRAAAPFACLAFALLAVPLALVSGGARGAAYLTTLAAFAAFYVLGRAGLVLAERGGSPWLAGFLPALVVAALGLVLSARLVRRGVGSVR